MDLTRRTLIAAPPLAAAIVAGSQLLPGDPIATGAGGLSLAPGVHRVARDTLIAGDVAMAPGARFEIAGGATLTLTGDLSAMASRLFQGAGRVDLNRSRILAVRPEWWGAIPDDAGVDCLAAFDAAVAAHGTLYLGGGDYHLSATWRVARPHARIWGVGRAGGRPTRLVHAGATDAVLLVGTDRPPASVNAFAIGIDVRWIELSRTAPAAAEAAGLAIRHVLDCNFEGLRAAEHGVGYSVRGAVRSFLRDCTAFRSLTSDAAGRDVFVGFDLDGRGGIGLAGGNASLYLIDCNARTGGRPRLATSIGARLTGAFADTALVRFETTETANGIAIDGMAATLSAGAARAGHADLHIDMPIIDQCTGVGIGIANLSDHALVDVRNPYVAVAPGARAAITLANCGGLTTISGGQLIGWPDALAGGSVAGLDLRGVRGLSVADTKLLTFARPIDGADVANFTLSPMINTRDLKTGAPAIRLQNARSGRLAIVLTGTPGAHSRAVTLNGASPDVTVDTAAVDRRAIGDPQMVERQ